MEASEFVTLHRSGDLEPDLARLRDGVGDRHLLVLPRPYDLMPGDVAADLLDAGATGGLEALVLERLTHADEAVTRTTLEDLAMHAGGDAPRTRRSRTSPCSSCAPTGDLARYSIPEPPERFSQFAQSARPSPFGLDKV